MIIKQRYVITDDRGFKVAFEQHQRSDSELIYKISTYSLIDDGYIGDIPKALWLVQELGIAPQKIEPTDDTCSIGWSEKKQLWFGWSHKAVTGFGIGYVIPEYVAEMLKGYPPNFHAKTLEDCKGIAIAYARSIQ